MSEMQWKTQSVIDILWLIANIKHCNWRPMLLDTYAYTINWKDK